MSGFWRLCIEISDRNVFPYGERAVWPYGALAAKTHSNGPYFSVKTGPSIVAEDDIVLGVCRLAEAWASLFWQTVALLLWLYLGTRGVPQIVVKTSANSLWQGGWRRAHSVKGGLPK